MVKIRFIGIAEGIEYTNDDDFDEDCGCIKVYPEEPDEEQIRQDLEMCLLFLQFSLPYGVKFSKCKFVHI